MAARFRSVMSLLSAATCAAALAGCGDGTAPRSGQLLAGTATDPGIAITTSFSHKSLYLLQTGAPEVYDEIALGASSAVTPVGFAVRGTHALIPLGDAGSVAYADLAQLRISRYFVFADEGNVTGIAWINDTAAVACRPLADYCGRFAVGQAGGTIEDTVQVTAFPTGVVVTDGRVFIISSNLDDSYRPAGNGVVTEIDPTTLAVVRTFTVGINPQFGAVGPDGNLYVVNTGTYSFNGGGNDGTLSVIDLGTNTAEEPITGFGDAPGAITIDAAGRAFISSYSYGTIVWNVNSRTFIRDTDDAVCAPLSGGGCRGANGAAIAPNGNLYQSYFGGPGYLFIYDGATLALRDSIPLPMGPDGLTITTFP